MKPDVIIDVDTGTDDALALLLAIKSRKLNIKGITTVGGNSDVMNTTSNTLKVISLGNTKIPVYMGSEKPLVKECFDYVKNMEPDGLAGLGSILPDSNTRVEKISAIEYLNNQTDTVTIIALAPLTNIAKVIQESASNIEAIYIMGGAVNRRGNVTEFAEFNFYNDPRAAKIVLESNIPIILVPLNVTEKLLVNTHDFIEKYKGSKNTIANFMSQILTNEKKKVGRDEFHLHDPLVIGAILYESFLKFKEDSLSVIDEGERAGQVVIGSKNKKIKWAYDVDVDRFVNYFEQTLFSDEN